MLILRDPALTEKISDPYIRAQVEQRFAEVFADEPYDAEQHGYFIVVEPGDTLEQLDQECGLPILEYFECVEDHHEFFEIVCILNDDGFGISCYVPRHTEGIDTRLLSVLEAAAIPAVTA
ncbi:MAG: hypothetical protein NTX56_06870 [Proteobacteria bacterium]|nr:hypothetical protein [Pseudomonadota bacterium]